MAIVDDLAKNQRFLQETEQSIRLANNEVIHNQIPPVNSERMLSFAVSVAKFRAQYISAAFTFVDSTQGENAEDTAKLDDLNLCRRRFEEARDAFIAMQRAIELGYMAVD